MARKTADLLTPEQDFHPFRVTFRLPELVLSEGWLVFDSAEGAAPHAGVRALLELSGVSSVTLYRNKVTLLRGPEREWDQILPEVRGILEREFVGKPAMTQPDATAPEGPAEESNAKDADPVAEPSGEDPPT